MRHKCCLYPVADRLHTTNDLHLILKITLHILIIVCQVGIGIQDILRAIGNTGWENFAQTFRKGLISPLLLIPFTEVWGFSGGRLNTHDLDVIRYVVRSTSRSFATTLTRTRTDAFWVRIERVNAYPENAFMCRCSSVINLHCIGNLHNIADQCCRPTRRLLYCDRFALAASL